MSHIPLYTVCWADQHGRVTVEILAEPDAARRRCHHLTATGIDALAAQQAIEIHP